MFAGGGFNTYFGGGDGKVRLCLLLTLREIVESWVVIIILLLLFLLRFFPLFFFGFQFVLDEICGVRSASEN